MKPPPDLPTLAAGVSDGMLATLLPCPPAARELIAQAREAFVAYCSAHPEHANVRAAWAGFHAALTTELHTPSVTLPIAFAAATTQPITVNTSAPATA